MNWYKTSKLHNKGIDGDAGKSLYLTCMFCKRWAVENGGVDPTWEKYENLSSSDKEEVLKSNMAILRNFQNSQVSISHMICSHCNEIMGGFDGYPTNEDEMQELVDKSLSVD